ncbi:hypothetical protein CRG98_017721 [Punica granatum]|uniref:Uncharacterized protein n=1 Tax=Punica granatum TaxID=22663 RepID=A0A2I0K029_PUNGR|nr:hypothetical protein CRG98_017721 [Punica granatum]
MTLTLSRDKVVACRQPFNHAPPPFLSFLPSRIFPVFTGILCIFQENIGMQSSRNLHRRDPNLVRSPMPPILHQKTTGSLLWNRFFIGCRSETLVLQSSRNHHRRDPQSVRSPMPLILHQKTTGSLLWSRFFIGCQSVRSPTQPALAEKATPINRYSPNKPDCQSGLPVDPTAPIRVCSFQPSLSTPFATSPTLSSCSKARYNHSTT